MRGEEGKAERKAAKKEQLKKRVGEWGERREERREKEQVKVEREEAGTRFSSVHMKNGDGSPF